jgi:hypothetical protein
VTSPRLFAGSLHSRERIEEKQTPWPLTAPPPPAMTDESLDFILPAIFKKSSRELAVDALTRWLRQT